MIKAENLDIGYDGKAILTGLNYEFQDNKVYGILAKSGYGKSTLLKTLSGLLPPVGGKVEIDGKTYRGTDNNPIYMMHQRYTNFGWLSCLDNVLIAQRNRKLRDKGAALQILHDVGLEGYEHDWPTKLSGGMQQRLALARVLYVKPKYLLMDEPLSALDDSTRIKMQNLVMNIHREHGGTIIMVTHSTTEANRVCDDIIKLEREEKNG